MAGNVISLTGAPCGVRQVSESCVATLRELLKMAEAGELVGIGLASLHYDGCASYYISGRAGGYSMLGALDMVRAELVDINKGYEA